MSTTFRPKSFAFVILFMSILFSYSLLNAAETSPINNAEHKKIMTQFISELKIIQNRIFRAAQLALDEPPENPSLTSDRKIITNDLSKLRQRVLDYNSNIPPTDLKNRELLLLRNAINDSQNSLYQLSEVSQTSTNLEKILLLEDYFEYKKSNEEALKNLENLLSRY